MRHRKSNKKLGMKLSRRIALLRSLSRALIKYGRIRTTITRAKALSKHIDGIIVLAKNGDLSARRKALAKIPDKDLINGLFETAKEKFGDRESGFAHVVRIEARPGDNAQMALVYFKEIEVG